MLGLVDSFSDKCLPFLWEQTVPHYWLTCFSIPTKMSFQINLLSKTKESLLESSVYHTIILMTLSLSIIKDLRSSFLILTPTNSKFLKPIASYLDLLFIRDKRNNIMTKLYDKHDIFGFHIVNFHFMSSNIPSALAHWPMVSMHLSLFAMPIVAQLIVIFYQITWTQK